MNSIASVVVTYNRLEMLKQCIDAISKQTVDCDVIIVDNASTDGTSEWAQNICADNNRIKYFNTGSNIGGAGGFNYGIKKAVDLGYDYVWIMDDDCMPLPDSLEKLMDANHLLGRDNYGYLSSVVLWTDGTECKMNRQKFAKGADASKMADNLKQVVQSSFVSLFLPAFTVKKIGLPIKEFFIWGDDVEYTRRITLRNNMLSYMVTDSKVIHAMKENNGSSIATDSVERIDRYNYAYRNENYLYRKEGIKGFAYYIAKCGLNILRVLTKAKNNRIKRIGIILKNLITGLNFNPDIEYV